MRQRNTSTFLVIAALACIHCNDNDTTTTVITTAAPTQVETSDPTDAATDATLGSTSNGDTTAALTDDDSTSTTSNDSTGDSSSGGQVEYTCWPGDACTIDADCGAAKLSCSRTAGECACPEFLDTATSFCGAIHSLAVESAIPEPYLGIIDTQCYMGIHRCETCFNLQNYCDQVGVGCAGLYEVCGCAGDVFDAP